jgi:hypothetical protein
MGSISRAERRRSSREEQKAARPAWPALEEVEYFVTSNIAFGLETKYLISRGHTLRINDGPERSGNLDSVFLSFAVRVFLFQL